MIFEVSNLGILKNAKIDLSKKLIIFTGENNTGKTYLSYIIYGLGSRDFTSRVVPISPITELIKDFKEKKFLEFDAIEFYAKYGKQLYERLAKSLQDFIPDLLGLDIESNKTSKIDIYWKSQEEVSTYFKNFAYAEQPVVMAADFIILRTKILNTGIYKFELKQTGNSTNVIPPPFIDNFLPSIIMSEFIPFIVSISLPAERIGVAIFGKELFTTRYDLTSQFRRVGNEKLGAIIKENTNIYPKPIDDVIGEVRKWGRRAKRQINDEFTKLADELETGILDGKVEVNKNDDVSFTTNNKRLTIQSSGSTVKSLATLVLALRNNDLEDKTIIMDEPEINLHPDNQRKVARVLAKLVNLGTQVIISTHSDYILREFNNLIMLGSNTKSAKKLQEKYSYSVNEILSFDKVSAYLFKRNHKENFSTCEEISLSDEGIQVETINDVINQQNNISFDIYQSLQEEKSNIKS